MLELWRFEAPLDIVARHRVSAPGGQGRRPGAFLGASSRDTRSAVDMTATFDAEHYKGTTRAQWQDAAAAWHSWGPTLEVWLGEATEAMLDAARVGAGS